MDHGVVEQRLGETIRQGLGDGPSAERRLAQRERLIQAAADPPRAVRWPWVMVAVAGVAAAVLLAWVAGPSLSGSAANDEPELVAEAGAPSEWIQAPAGGEHTMDFDGNTHLRLVDGARGRVATPTSDRGEVVLESGRIEAEVEPEAGRRWSVAAGPYSVVVVGTVFSVDWDPDAGRLEVEVQRGKVEVRGPMGAESIGVVAGHRLHAQVSDSSVHLEPSVPASVEDGGEEAGEDAEPAIERRSPRERNGRRPRTQNQGPNWRSLAKDGEYEAALALAREQGFDGLLKRLSSADLLLLGDTARLARDTSRARSAYQSVRKRFGGSQAAARAAFQLGRLAADKSRDHAGAAKWFRTYLKEQPSGSFAREARGRLVQALDKAGNKSAAVEAAKDYLKRHPKGPHAKLARSLVDG